MPAAPSLWKEWGAGDFKGICPRQIGFALSKQKLDCKEVVTRLVTKSIILIFSPLIFPSFLLQPSWSSWIWVPSATFKARISVSGEFHRIQKNMKFWISVFNSLHGKKLYLTFHSFCSKAWPKAEIWDIINLTQKLVHLSYPICLQWA